MNVDIDGTVIFTVLKVAVHDDKGSYLVLDCK